MPDTYSIDAQIRAVQRELDRRELIYPRAVAEGRMNEHHAAQQLAVMREVLRTLLAVAADAPPKVSRGR